MTTAIGPPTGKAGPVVGAADTQPIAAARAGAFRAAGAGARPARDAGPIRRTEQT